jgi:hypothetical protein
MGKPSEIAAATAAVLLAPQVALAHSLDPMYVGLGPYSLSPIVESYGLLLVPLLLAHVLILRTLVSFDRRFLDVAWRAAVIFVVSKIAEFLPGLAFLGQAWRNPSIGETALFTTLLFAASFGANLLMIGVLFRNDVPRPWRLLLASFALTATSYAMMLLCAFACA